MDTLTPLPGDAMGLIERAAFFSICEKCGEHGKFVFADGTESKTFYSRSDAKVILIMAFEDGRVSDEELRYLETQIDSCDLPWETKPLLKALKEILEIGKDPDLGPFLH